MAVQPGNEYSWSPASHGGPYLQSWASHPITSWLWAAAWVSSCLSRSEYPNIYGIDSIHAGLVLKDLLKGK
jgi:hypothetical protein